MLRRKKGNPDMKRKYIGSTFDRFLRDEGIYEQVSAAAIKRVVARQVEATTKGPHKGRESPART